MELSDYKTLNQSAGHEKTSHKYSFIPTTKVLDQLETYGWMPSKVVEMRTNKESFKGFQKHAVRLRHQDYSIADVGFPEIVLTNSHLGNASFKLQLGLFRVVCANGMIAGDIYKTASVRHMGFTEELVHNAITALTMDAPRLITDISTMRDIILTKPEQEAYAEAVIDLAFDGEKYDIPSENVLLGRRGADGYGLPQERSLFNTFNVVQENVIKGGIVQFDKLEKKRRRSRPITSLDRSEKINQVMWKLADTIKNVRAGVN